MKKFSIFLILIFLIFSSSLKAYSLNPKDFVNELVNDVITKLGDENLNTDQKKNFVREIALEHVDIKALSLYTLGELRKSSDSEVLVNYQKSFEKYFLKSLTSRLSDYSSSKFEVLSSDKKSDNYTIVNSKVKPSEKRRTMYSFLFSCGQFLSSGC